MHPLLSKKGFILDVDGVICRGRRPIEDGIRAVRMLKDMGKRIVFVSNNSTRSRKMFLERFSEFGLDVGEKELILATYATARFIANEKDDAKVFTTGEEGLIEELELAGLRVVDYDEAEYLVVGFNRRINYDIMTKALRLCLRGTRYIATNPDRIFPGEDGPIPGTGMIIGALYWMTGRLPDVVVGKPSKVIMGEALRTLGLKSKDVVVVGDQMEIDIKAGREIGATTLLVLSGVTKGNDLSRYDERPDYVLPHLGALFW